jgi:CSLREA domain-containing protein
MATIVFVYKQWGFPWSLLLALLAAGLGLTSSETAAQVSTYIVTKTADSDDEVCDGDCSLREAITVANNTAGSNMILFSLPANSTITLGGSQLPAISGTLTIDGYTTSGLTINGNDESRIFQVAEGATATLTHLTISNGALAPDGGCPTQCGGGILNEGNLTVLDSTFIENLATIGGAIHNAEYGVLTVHNTIFRKNWASVYGGGIYNLGSLTLSNSTVRDHIMNNAAVHGGGIFNGGTLLVEHSVISNNTLFAELAAYGAGIYNSGVLTLTQSIVRDNVIDHNMVDGSGAGISNAGEASILYSTISGNQGIEGGGIFTTGTDMLTISNSTISNNTAAWGGGIYSNASAEVTILYSTLNDNLAGGWGGGIFSAGLLTVLNSTISSNTADRGGGIHQVQRSATLDNSTLSNNTATQVGDGGNIFLEGATLYWRNTIMANGVGGDCADDIGTIGTSSNTLAEDGSCEATLSGDPLLGPLQASGGATPTHALLAGSPAIEAGDPATCLADDQRGVVRPKDGDGDGTAVCDIGAYEFVRFTDFAYLPMVHRP